MLGAMIHSGLSFTFGRLDFQLSRSLDQLFINLDEYCHGRPEIRVRKSCATSTARYQQRLCLTFIDFIDGLFGRRFGCPLRRRLLAELFHRPPHLPSAGAASEGSPKLVILCCSSSFYSLLCLNRVLIRASLCVTTFHGLFMTVKLLLDVLASLFCAD